MPTLRYYCLLLTDGQRPELGGSADSGFQIVELGEVPRFAEQPDFFGPHAEEAGPAFDEAKAAFLFYGYRPARREAGAFFGAAHAQLARAVAGMRGLGVDVLRMWPFPLREARELPEDPLAEDLFSVGFQERPGGGFRAETFGLAKLDQREVSFDFRGRDLVDEASVLCARLVEYTLGQSGRVEHGQALSFGFDRVGFRAVEGHDAGGSLRGWHPVFVQRALPEAVFPGVGRLEVNAFEPMSERTAPDLTDALRRSFEQRLVVGALESPLGTPHQSTLVRACLCAGGEQGLCGFREEPASVRDSGWTFVCARPPPGPHEIGVGPLGALVRRLPQILKYLGLPAGSHLEWSGTDVRVDAGGAAPDGDEDG